MSNTDNITPDNSHSSGSPRTHESMRDLLDAYSTDELEEEDRVLLERHFSACDECQQELEEIRQIRAVLATHSAPASPQDVTASVERALPKSTILPIVDSVLHELTKSNQPPQHATEPMDEPCPVSDVSSVSPVEAQNSTRPAAFDVTGASLARALLRPLRQPYTLRRGETVYMQDAPETENDRNSALPFVRQDSHPHARSSLVRWGRGFSAMAAVLILIVGSVLVFTLVHVPPGSGKLGGGDAHHTPDASDSPTALGTTQVGSEMPNDGWTRLWTLPAIEITNAPAPITPAIAWSSANDQTLYLCRNGLFVTFAATPPPTQSPLLYRSVDGGVTWLAVPLPEPAAACMIHPDAAIPHRVVLQDDRGNNFVSNDAGEHWQLLRLPSALTSSSGLPVVAAGGRIYVGGYWTSDMKTWNRWYPGPDESQSTPMAVNPQHPDTIYALLDNCAGAPSSPAWARHGVCRSDDGGHTWRFQLTLQAVPGSSETFCVAPANPDMLYVWAPGGVLAHGRRIDGLAQSTDGGDTWESVKALNLTGSGIPLSPADAPCSTPTPGIYGADISMTDDGTLFLASASEQTMLGQSILASVSVYKAGNWKMVATYPLRQNGSHGGIVQVAWLIQSSGQYTLMGLSTSALYRTSRLIAP